MVAAAGGARMQEGILSLMQMPRTTSSSSNYASVAALHCSADRPDNGRRDRLLRYAGRYSDCRTGALIGFAGPRVIQDTIKEKLPEGFQRAEYCWSMA